MAKIVCERFHAGMKDVFLPVDWINFKGDILHLES